MLKAGNAGECCECIFGVRGGNKLGFAEVVFCLCVFELRLRRTVEHTNRLDKNSEWGA